MKLYIDFKDFEPWGEAYGAWERIKRAKKLDELESYFDNMYSDAMSETTLNNILWFKPETIYEWLGMEQEAEEEFDEDDGEDVFKFCQHFSDCLQCPLQDIPGACIDILVGPEYDKLMRCIDGQELNKYNKDIFFEYNKYN